MSVPEDIAIRKVDGSFASLKLAATDPKVGAHVFAIGSPLNLSNTLSDGLVSGVRAIAPKRQMLQISTPISPGSSGGPLLAEDFTVVGVTTSQFEEGQNLNFAVSARTVQRVLDKATTRPTALNHLADYWIRRAEEVAGEGDSITLAEVEALAGNIPSAATFAKNANAEQVFFGGYLRNMAVALIDRGSNDEALAFIAKIAKPDEQWLKQATLRDGVQHLARLGALDEAMRFFRMMDSAGDLNGSAVSEIVREQVKSGELDQALAMLDGSSRTAGACFIVATALAARGDYDRAEKITQRYKAIDRELSSNVVDDR